MLELDVRNQILEKRQKGVSLVEVILGLVVIGFIIMVILSSPSSLQIIGFSKRESVAKDIALKQIEDTRTKSYDTISVGTTLLTPTIDSRITQLGTWTGSKIVIDDCDPGPPASTIPASVCTGLPLVDDIKLVTVTMQWKDNQNTKSFQMSTLISRNGLK